MAHTCKIVPRDAQILQNLLAALRAAHWSHWTSHWQVKGAPYYGDHLLLDKIYNGITEDIDTLAEKIVAYFGGDAVDPVCQAQMMQAFLELNFYEDPIQRALQIELVILQLIEETFRLLEGMGKLPLGVNDYLAAAANTHETFVYLLRQRTR